MGKRKWRWFCKLVGHQHNTNPVEFWCPRCGLAYEEFCGGLDMWGKMNEWFRNSDNKEVTHSTSPNTESVPSENPMDDKP